MPAKNRGVDFGTNVISKHEKRFNADVSCTHDSTTLGRQEWCRGI